MVIRHDLNPHICHHIYSSVKNNNKSDASRQIPSATGTFNLHLPLFVRPHTLTHWSDTADKQGLPHSEWHTKCYFFPKDLRSDITFCPQLNQLCRFFFFNCTSTQTRSEETKSTKFENPQQINDKDLDSRYLHPMSLLIFSMTAIPSSSFHHDSCLWLLR